MIKKNFSLYIFIFFVFLVFVITSFYSFRLKRIQNQGPSLTPIISLDVPSTAAKKEPISVSWQIDTKTPRRITTTTIYYSQESTPSAVTTQDSPLALGYEFAVPDYQTGDWQAPQTFTATITPPLNLNEIFLRAYALIDNDHYWTKEYKIILK